MPATALSRSSQHKHGFTLAEILVSVLIFLIISGAMFGIFLSVTKLYREGEFSRSSNDESQIVTNLIEADLANIVPGNAGGIFYAWLDNSGQPSNTESNGNCVLGWVMRNKQPNASQPTPFVFVIWGVIHEDEEPLRRMVFNINGDLESLNLTALNAPTRTAGTDDILNTSDDIVDVVNFNPNDPLPSLAYKVEQATTITQGCLYFGASLSGTAHDIDGTFTVCHKPAINVGESDVMKRTTYWTYVTDGNLILDDEPYSEPFAPGSHYSNNDTLSITGETYQKTFPNAVRLNLILSGSERFSKSGQLASNLPNDDKINSFRIAGIETIPASPGSLIRIGDSINAEWVGYYDVTTNGLIINDSWDDGPCMPNSSNDFTGRGVLKSTPKDHTIGAEGSYWPASNPDQNTSRINYCGYTTCCTVGIMCFARNSADYLTGKCQTNAHTLCS